MRQGGLVLCAGPLHLIFTILLEAADFEIFDWREWGRMLQGLPDAHKLVRDWPWPAAVSSAEVLRSDCWHGGASASRGRLLCRGCCMVACHGLCGY